MKDYLKIKIAGIYGWSVAEDGSINPPVHRFPNQVKERADYFAEMLEDGLTFLGCLDCIFSDEKPEGYDFGATKEWLPKSEEFKEWEGLLNSMAQQEMAMYLTFPIWEEEERK